MANSYRRKGTRISAMVGSDGDIGLAPAVSLGVHKDGAGREKLKVLARVGPGMFKERNYDIRAVRDYVSSAEDCPAAWQTAWAEIEAEICRREAGVTILVWDRVQPHIRERLLTLPPIALIQRCERSTPRQQPRVRPHEAQAPVRCAPAVRSHRAMPCAVRILRHRPG